MRPRSLTLAVILMGGVFATCLIGTAAAGQATTPSARGTAQGRSPHDPRVRPQGFSMVLVLGDLRAAPGEEDVPPAARKALTDMKDFLPYRSYRLLDAAWILCCNSNRGVTRLRGPDDHEYEIEIESNPVEQARMAVRFTLRDLAGGESVKQAPPAVKGVRTVDQEKRLEQLKAQIEEARRDSARHPDIAKLEAELAATQQRLAQIKEADRQADPDKKGTPDKKPETAGPSKLGDRSIMNTSFTMDIGETVVVGTSRLSGNSKALIALLTAVPSKSIR